MANIASALVNVIDLIKSVYLITNSLYGIFIRMRAYPNPIFCDPIQHWTEF